MGAVGAHLQEGLAKLHHHLVAIRVIIAHRRLSSGTDVVAAAEVSQVTAVGVYLDPYLVTALLVADRDDTLGREDAAEHLAGDRIGVGVDDSLDGDDLNGLIEPAAGHAHLVAGLDVHLEVLAEIHVEPAIGAARGAGRADFLTAA